MQTKPITVEEYKEVAPEFFAKYWYIAKELGENAKTEDVLKIMESLASLVMKQRFDGKVGPFGFNKKPEKTEETTTAKTTNLFNRPYSNQCPGGVMVNGECCDI